MKRDCKSVPFCVDNNKDHKIMSRLRTIDWCNDSVKIVDQTKLPTELIYKELSTVKSMFEAIKTLQVRGAPAIGVAAAYGLYLGIRNISGTSSKEDFTRQIHEQSKYLDSSRPTAINLRWALDRMLSFYASALDEITEISILKERLLGEAHQICMEDIESCKAIGAYGYELLRDYNTLLTHCNAGGLATVEYGTALAPVYIGKEKGKIFTVYADETRPLLQGARITAFELKEAKIPVVLICDNMAATVIAQGRIDAVIVGADRIAANGDTANKIGTYGVALAAKAHNIPFFVAAPFSTFDTSIPTGKEIPIEERPVEEILQGFGKQTGPSGVECFNPAFDVTPHNLITAIITEKGVLYPSFTESITLLKTQ